jgi:hypothetical protein
MTTLGPKRAERTCDQVLSPESGGGDMNSLDHLGGSPPSMGRASSGW